MLGNLRGYIAVDSEYLKVVVVVGDFVDVLISDLAVWIPLCCEVDNHKGKSVGGEVVVHEIELHEAFEGCKVHASESSHHATLIL